MTGTTDRAFIASSMHQGVAVRKATRGQQDDEKQSARIDMDHGRETARIAANRTDGCFSPGPCLRVRDAVPFVDPFAALPAAQSKLEHAEAKQALAGHARIC
jgi:hypothetical protein